MPHKFALINVCKNNYQMRATGINQPDQQIYGGELQGGRKQQNSYPKAAICRVTVY